MKLWVVFLMAVSASAQAGAPVFRTEARLVEVPLTVVDNKGRMQTGLPQDRFEVLEDGRSRPIATFESTAADLSIAILLDTTGSMQEALPGVKRSINQFIDRLRPNDSVAVFTFSSTLQEQQDFTQDKSAAKRAVLRTKATGSTALFDGIAQTISSMAKRKGRKALVVFTDGQDNSSVLNSSAAVRAAATAGVPIFSVASGEGVRSKGLRELLEKIAEATGGRSYVAKKASDVDEMFLEIASYAQAMYLLTYSPAPVEDAKWRAISVRLRGDDRLKVRARTGYYPD
jgi:VWFA-related protein